MFSRWMRSGNKLPVQSARCASAKSSRARLTVETLEDRVVPSTLTYEQWQGQRFHTDDVPIANVSVQSNGAPQPVNQSFGSLIGLDRAFADYAYRGQGVSVAVIDTGIDYNHPDLGGGWGKRVIAGYDFVNHDNDPMDDDGHGTHVAGIIGSSNTTYSGIAPEVNLIALKVLDADGGGTFGDVELALQWVLQHQAQYNIVAVNLSLGSGNYSVSPFTYLDDEFTSLRSKDVFLAVAAGNSYFTFGGQPGLSFPAVSSDVVSVGAVWAKDVGQVSWMSGARDFNTGPDRIASFSQRSAALDLMAPGGMITSTYLDGSYQAMAGTSMATPVVAGAAALIHQALSARGLPADQDAVLQVLRSSGVTIIDGDDEQDNVANTGLSFQRLEVHAALASIAGLANDGRPMLSPVPDISLLPGSTRVIVLSATDPDGDTLSFSANLINAGGGDLGEIQQQYGFTYLGNYHLNVWGSQEKWLGSSAGAWYCILPDGQLRRWAGTMNATLEPGNLVTTLNAGVYADPSLLWNAHAIESPPVTISVVGNLMTITAPEGYTGTVQVSVAVSDGNQSVNRIFTVSVANKAPVWGALPDQTMKSTEDQRVLPLTATDPEGQPLTYSAVAVPLTGTAAPAVALSIQGNLLTIDPAATFAGACRIEVTASDGVNSSTTAFTLTVANAAPTLNAIANLTIKRGRSGTVSLSAGSDEFTYSFKAFGSNYVAYELDQQLQLSYQGSYFQNMLGMKEKWMTAPNESGGLDWYCILPNGDVRRRDVSKAATLSAANLVAKLDKTYYAKPQLLWNAQLQAAPAVSFQLTGNRLTITPPAKYKGTFFVEVLVSDGMATARRVFSVRVA